MRIITLSLFVLLSALSLGLHAQTDNSVVKVDSNMLNPGTKNKRPDSSSVKTPKKKEVVKDSARLALEMMPKIALRRALILPGWGQVYNKQVWKLPFVAGGFVGIGLVFNFYQKNYKDVLKEVQFRTGNSDQHLDSYYNAYGTPNLITIKDFYRRNRDLSIIGGVGFYAIQAIDAYVKAKFARYDISNNLGLKIGPGLQSSPYSASNTVPSLKITLSL